MAEDGSHSGTGRWIALATAVVTLVGAAVSAGLVHVKDNGDFPVGPGGGNVITTVPTPSPGLTPTPTPSTSWRVEAVQVCDVGQEAVADVDGQDYSRDETLRATATVVRQMDQLLREIDAPEPQKSQLQLMATQWDQAWSALERMLDAELVGDGATASDRHADYGDLNGRGNQIAETLGIARCAAVGPPSMGGS